MLKRKVHPSPSDPPVAQFTHPPPILKWHGSPIPLRSSSGTVHPSPSDPQVAHFTTIPPASAIFDLVALFQADPLALSHPVLIIPMFQTKLNPSTSTVSHILVLLAFP